MYLKHLLRHFYPALHNKSFSNLFCIFIQVWPTVFERYNRYWKSLDKSFLTHLTRLLNLLQNPTWQIRIYSPSMPYVTLEINTNNIQACRSNENHKSGWALELLQKRCVCVCVCVCLWWMEAALELFEDLTLHGFWQGAWSEAFIEFSFF